MARKIYCIKDKYSKKYLLKDHGDTCNYVVLSINKATKEITLKVDKRLNGEKENFFAIYGGSTGAKLTEEDKVTLR